MKERHRLQYVVYTLCKSKCREIPAPAERSCYPDSLTCVTQCLGLKEAQWLLFPAHVCLSLLWLALYHHVLSTDTHSPWLPVVTLMYNTIVICKTCSTRVKRGGKKSMFLTQQILLKLLNIISAIFAHCILAFLTLRCTKVHELLF